MDTLKEVLNFCNDAVFYDYSDIDITCDLNQVRTFVINRFYKSIPHSRIRVCLCIFDDIILKINNNDIEIILENFHDLRENTSYMLSFEKLIKDNNGKLIIGDDNDIEDE